MLNPQNPQTLIPADAAKETGVSVHTIRRWCEWHAAYLSEGANPPEGAPRKFTWKDIEVFKTIKELREKGMQTPAVNERLASTTFAIVESEPDIGSEEPTLPQTQQGRESSETAMMVIEAINAVMKRVDAVEKRQSDYIVGFMFGVLVCAVLFLLILMLFLLTR